MYNRTCSTATERLLHGKTSSVAFASLTGKDIKHIIAYKLHYHQNCYRKYTKKQRPITEVESTNQVIFEYIREKLIEGNEIIYKKDLVDAYNNRLPLEVESVMSVRLIIEKILKEFENISLLKPTYGKQFLYQESLSKGEIIIHYIKKLLELQEKTGKIEKVNKIPNQEDSVKLAAKLIKEEILNTPNTYTNWPPTAAELLQRKTTLPHLTEVFLKQILSSRTNQQLSTQRQNIFTSIGQDLIYNVTNTKRQTSKHALLSVCTKRRTGSKKMIRWLNMFGHGISYDEVAFVETTLAEDEIQNQFTRSYCLIIAKPSVYVIFKLH